METILQPCKKKNLKMLLFRTIVLQRVIYVKKYLNNHNLKTKLLNSQYINIVATGLKNILPYYLIYLFKLLPVYS